MTVRFSPILLAAMTAVALLAGACRSADVEPDVATSDPAAIDLLERIDLDIMTRAFEEMSRTAHRLELNIQAQTAGRTAFSSARDLSYDGRSAAYAVAHVETSGEAPDGFWSRLHGSVQPLEPAVMSSLLTLRDPVFLDDQGRNAFRYTLGADSTVYGVRARTLTIERRPGEDQGRPYERARLYIEPVSGAVVAYELWLDERTLFFEEQTRRRTELGRAGGDGWLPRHIEIHTRVKNFLAPSHTISSEWTFSGAHVTAGDGAG